MLMFYHARYDLTSFIKNEYRIVPFNLIQYYDNQHNHRDYRDKIY